MDNKTIQKIGDGRIVFEGETYVNEKSKRVKTNNRIAVEERLFHFVKASERIPKEPGIYLCRERNKNRLVTFKKAVGKQSDFHRNPKEIEWLEEIKEHLPVEDEKDKLIKELQDQSTLLYQENVKLLQAVKLLEPVVEDGKIKILENIMSDFGEAHTMLAKTKLDSKEYNPISLKLAQAKIDLFNFYNAFKNSKSLEEQPLKEDELITLYLELKKNSINYNKLLNFLSSNEIKYALRFKP